MNSDVPNEARSVDDAPKGDWIRKEVQLPVDLHDGAIFVATADRKDFSKYVRDLIERDVFGRKASIQRRIAGPEHG